MLGRNLAEATLNKWLSRAWLAISHLLVTLIPWISLYYERDTSSLYVNMRNHQTHIERVYKIATKYSVKLSKSQLKNKKLIDHGRHDCHIRFWMASWKKKTINEEHGEVQIKSLEHYMDVNFSSYAFYYCIFYKEKFYMHMCGIQCDVLVQANMW